VLTGIRQRATDHLVRTRTQARILCRDPERLDGLSIETHVAVRHAQIVMPLGVSLQLRLDPALELAQEAVQIGGQRGLATQRHLDAARLDRRAEGHGRDVPRRVTGETLQTTAC
jgi:hypothetical protein